MATAKIKPTIGPIKSPERGKAGFQYHVEPWINFPGGYEAWKKRKGSLPSSPKRTILPLQPRKRGLPPTPTRLI